MQLSWFGNYGQGIMVGRLWATPYTAIMPMDVTRYQNVFDVMGETMSVGGTGQSIATEHVTTHFRWITESAAAIRTPLLQRDGTEDEDGNQAIF